MIEQLVAEFEAWAESFGAVPKGVNCLFRNNTDKEAFENGGAFFGIIQPEEAIKGGYHDFSLVVFPDNKDGMWVVCLCVGTLGFKHDFELATQPGLRRRFLKITSNNGYTKDNFLDIEVKITRDFDTKTPNISKTLNAYNKFISSCEIVNPNLEEGRDKIKGYLALYADIRGWGSNREKRTRISHSIAKAKVPDATNDDRESVQILLNERKYIVLQGAPGTGKTRLAKLIAKNMKAKVFFTQFHAETSNADFVWGIRPKLKSEQLGYEPREGELVKAIRWAIDNPNSKVVLIIDEINRANLSNVLGPVFYLFEYQMEPSDIKITITSDLELDRLPDNFYVIATMNTADRSLAVVDFALRRRFAWYTLWPTAITTDNGLTFYKEYFDRIADIFEQFANDEELNLQPGQGYFIAKDKEEMKNRLRFEVLPLIKEYLVEGLLAQSKNSFASFFHQSINEVMFR